MVWNTSHFLCSLTHPHRRTILWLLNNCLWITQRAAKEDVRHSFLCQHWSLTLVGYYWNTIKGEQHLHGHQQEHWDLRESKSGPKHGIYLLAFFCCCFVGLVFCFVLAFHAVFLLSLTPWPVTLVVMITFLSMALLFLTLRRFKPVPFLTP